MYDKNGPAAKFKAAMESKGVKVGIGPLTSEGADKHNFGYMAVYISKDGGGTLGTKAFDTEQKLVDHLQSLDGLLGITIMRGNPVYEDQDGDPY